MEKAFEALGRANNQCGIVYLSRVPPYMKVEKVRHIFDRFGTTKRIYLDPFDATTSNKRKKNYKQGWIEFSDKNDAKDCAQSLNNNLVGGKGFHSDDIWNVKYLSDFQWHHLQTQLSRNRAVKQSKLRLLKAKVAKEHDFYATQIKTSKKFKAINERVSTDNNNIKNKFKQRKVVDDENLDIQDEADVKEVLGALFQ